MICPFEEAKLESGRTKSEGEERPGTIDGKTKVIDTKTWDERVTGREILIEFQL